MLSYGVYYTLLLNDLGPKYISDVLLEYKPNKSLKLLGLSWLKIPRVHSKHGETALSYYATHSWNQRPENIRCSPVVHSSPD